MKRDKLVVGRAKGNREKADMRRMVGKDNQENDRK
jgi:hypothetical protein